jgi:hypothetical protein
MEKTDKTEIETRDEIVQLLLQQGGVTGHHTAVELANAILVIVNGRPVSAAGGPPTTLPTKPAPVDTASAK